MYKLLGVLRTSFVMKSDGKRVALLITTKTSAMTQSAIEAKVITL